MDAANEPLNRTESNNKKTGDGNNIELDILSFPGSELKYMTIVSRAIKKQLSSSGDQIVNPKRMKYLLQGYFKFSYVST